MTDAESSKVSGIKRRGGTSIRTLSVVLFIVAILAVLFSLFESQRSLRHAHALYELERERQKCDGAIQQFMDGSDYLTYQVQQFVIKGERGYMDGYWTEVNQTKSRDLAVDLILAANITPEEREAATNGKKESDALIQGEIWAMRMVSESVGISEAELPPEIAAYRLEPDDAALSDEEKRAAAIAYIFGPDYSLTKSAIRNSVNTFRNEITDRYADEAISALGKTQNTSLYISAALAVFLLVLLAAVISFFVEVVSPLVDFAGKLSRRGDGRAVTLREAGAMEIRQFARAFNALSERTEQNTRRLERLGYVDYLTEVPNRASITEYVGKLIKGGSRPIGLMIIDIDNFKKFNDNYGHALGDRVLKQVAQAVCSVQPPDSGISGRLCGEEFIVASQGADEATLFATAEKILKNVRRIGGAEVDLPDEKNFRITVSIGGMLYQSAAPAEFNVLLSRADKALYVSKCSGKDRYTFFREEERAL